MGEDDDGDDDQDRELDELRGVSASLVFFFSSFLRTEEKQVCRFPVRLDFGGGKCPCGRVSVRPSSRSSLREIARRRSFLVFVREDVKGEGPNGQETNCIYIHPDIPHETNERTSGIATARTTLYVRANR